MGLGSALVSERALGLGQSPSAGDFSKRVRANAFLRLIVGRCLASIRAPTRRTRTKEELSACAPENWLYRDYKIPIIAPSGYSAAGKPNLCFAAVSPTADNLKFAGRCRFYRLTSTF